MIDFSDLDYVPKVTTAPLSLGPAGGEIWCASDKMVEAFSGDPRWKTEVIDKGWTFKVKPAAAKTQAASINNLNSSKPEFTWK